MNTETVKRSYGVTRTQRKNLMKNNLWKEPFTTEGVKKSLKEYAKLVRNRRLLASKKRKDKHALAKANRGAKKNAKTNNTKKN